MKKWRLWKKWKRDNKIKINKSRFPTFLGIKNVNVDQKFSIKIVASRNGKKERKRD